MKKDVLLIMFCLISIFCISQIGIGTKNPDPNALVDLSSSSKGLLIPRITLEQRNEITSPSNSILYYLNDENCINFYSSNNSRWRSICGEILGSVEVNNPANIQIVGSFDTNPNEELNEKHYMIVPVTINESGQVNILGTTTNGYFFNVSKTFPIPGNYNIIVPAEGNPTTARTDIVTISVNGKIIGTKENIVTEYLTKNYTLNCTSIYHNPNVSNIYRINKQLTSDNWFEIKVDYQNDTRGLSYNITTNTVEGISFSASGNFPSGGNSTTIRLMGKGLTSSFNIK